MFRTMNALKTMSPVSLLRVAAAFALAFVACALLSPTTGATAATATAAVAGFVCLLTASALAGAAAVRGVRRR